MDAACTKPLQNARRATRRCRGIEAAHGFTLIEFGIVVAVLVVLAASVAPGLHRLIESRRLNGVASQLAADIQYARSAALARNRSLRLSFYAGVGASCYVVHTGAASQCACAGAGPAHCNGDATEIRTVVLPIGERIALQANVASMLFDPAHGTSTPTGTLRVLDSRGHAVHHVVNIMGRVRSCSPQGAVPGYRAC